MSAINLSKMTENESGRLNNQCGWLKLASYGCYMKIWPSGVATLIINMCMLVFKPDHPISE